MMPSPIRNERCGGRWRSRRNEGRRKIRQAGRMVGRGPVFRRFLPWGHRSVLPRRGRSGRVPRTVRDHGRVVEDHPCRGRDAARADGGPKGFTNPRPGRHHEGPSSAGFQPSGTHRSGQIEWESIRAPYLPAAASTYSFTRSRFSMEPSRKRSIGALSSSIS